MRTTLTLDDDLAGILRERSRELGKPFKEVVNLAIRKGLADSHQEKMKQEVRVRPYDFGGMKPGIDGARLNQLVDELEVEDHLRKASSDDSAGR